MILRGCLYCLFAGLLAARAEPLPAGVRRVLFLGDSITHAGEYVDYATLAMRMAYPQRPIEWLNLGVPAETVAGITEAGFADGRYARPDLKERLARVLARTKPQLVVVCYGMNDGVYAPFSEQRFRRFCEGMEAVHRAIVASGAEVLHLTPPVFDPLPVRDQALPAGRTGYGYPQPYAGYDRDVLGRYSQWLLSRRSAGWHVVDLHGTMGDYLAKRRRSDPNFTFSTDGVHPDALGHAVMARCLLRYWGVPDRFAELPFAFTEDPAWKNLAGLMHERDVMLIDAWVSAVGSTRPDLPKGLPVADATVRAAAIDARIDAALGKYRAGPGSLVWGGAAIRSSFYVTVRDGTRLALDLYCPADVAGTPLPVVLRATPYHRSIATDSSSQGLYYALVKHGYIVASLDLRGHGASFGKIYGGGFDGVADRLDLYDVIEWLGMQPWCSGKVGMAGGSYEGLVQFWAASAMPPHLKAIAPTAAPLDTYSSYRVNGVFQKGASAAWDRVVRADDLVQLSPRVDGDKDGTLLAAAVAEHRTTWRSGLAAATPPRSLPFRDSPPPPGGFKYALANWWNFAANFRLTKIPVLQFGGWDDKFVDQTFAIYRTLAQIGVVQRLVVGPWYHTAWYRSRLGDVVGEHLRWYDRWLKGIGGGAANEPPVRYYVSGSDPGREWRQASGWPLPNQKRVVFFLANGELAARPGLSSGSDPCCWSPSFSTDRVLTRWNYADKGPGTPEYGLQPVSMDSLNTQGTVYTTAPLAGDMQVTGFPVLTVWAKVPVGADLFAFLEEVDASGHATLLCDGAIRAADSAEAEAPFPNEGLPWHPCLSGLSGTDHPATGPVRLRWALFPLSNLIRKGHRLRLLLTGHDGAGWDAPPPMPGAEVRIYHENAHLSELSLPTVR